MKKIEITKKGKIVLSVVGVIVLIGIIGLIIFFTTNNKVEQIGLNVDVLTEGDTMDYETNTLILHIDSKAQLSYFTMPKNKKIDVNFNNYDKDVISIDSKGIITGLRAGKTEIKIYDKNYVESNLIRVYVY